MDSLGYICAPKGVRCLKPSTREFESTPRQGHSVTAILPLREGYKEQITKSQSGLFKEKMENVDSKKSLIAGGALQVIKGKMTSFLSRWTNPRTGPTGKGSYSRIVILCAYCTNLLLWAQTVNKQYE